MERVPPGGAVVFRRSAGGGGTGVNYDLGSEPWSAEVLVVGGKPMAREKDSMALRRIYILSTLELATSGFPDRK